MLENYSLSAFFVLLILDNRLYPGVVRDIHLHAAGIDGFILVDLINTRFVSSEKNC